MSISEFQSQMAPKVGFDDDPESSHGRGPRRAKHIVEKRAYVVPTRACLGAKHKSVKGMRLARIKLHLGLGASPRERQAHALRVLEHRIPSATGKKKSGPRAQSNGPSFSDKQRVCKAKVCAAVLRKIGVFDLSYAAPHHGAPRARAH